MNCKKCGLKVNSKRNQSELVFMMTEGKEVIRMRGNKRIVNHYCRKCNKNR